MFCCVCYDDCTHNHVRCRKCVEGVYCVPCYAELEKRNFNKCCVCSHPFPFKNKEILNPLLIENEENEIEVSTHTRKYYQVVLNFIAFQLISVMSGYGLCWLFGITNKHYTPPLLLVLLVGNVGLICGYSCLSCCYYVEYKNIRHRQTLAVQV